MKIIDLLTPNQLSNIDELVKSYGKNNEFEVSLFSNNWFSSLRETNWFFCSNRKRNNRFSCASKIAIGFPL